MDQIIFKDKICKVFYGCARKHRINVSGSLVLTNDNVLRFGCNFTCDIRNILAGEIKPGINLLDYDGFIFTPPCNYYSKANYRREISEVSLQTKDLLPLCLTFCVNSCKPFIVENVMNNTLLKDLYPEYQFRFGGHTFWTNWLCYGDFLNITFEKNQNKQYLSRNKRDGNKNVDLVLTYFVRKLVNYKLNEVIGSD